MREGVGQGDLAAVKAAARVGDVDERFDDGLTALILAAYSGNVEIVRFLLESGANPNVQNDDGETCLVSGTAPENADEIIPLLLAGGADPNLRDSQDRSPLVWAALQGHVGATSALVKAGADLSARDKEGVTALAAAVVSGHGDILDVLLAAGGTTDRGKAAMIAVNGEKPEMVLKIVDSGLSVDYAEGDPPSALLHYAALYGHVDTARGLLKRGATADILGRDDTAPLGLAAYAGHVDVVRALLEAGAEVDHVTAMKGSALRAAAETGARGCVEVLLAAGADPLLKDKWDKLPVNYATENGHVAVAELLTAAAGERKSR